MDRKRETKGVRGVWDKYKFAILVVVAGAVLLLWPGRKMVKNTASSAQAAEARDLETEMEEILSKIAGVGQVQVMLTEDADGEKQLAQDTKLSYSGSTKAPEDYSRSSEVVLTDSGGEDTVVVTRQQYPTYRGALVVCQGAGSSAVRLAVTEAVAALTGLSSDRVTVAKWQ